MKYLDYNGLAYFWNKIKTHLNGKQDALTFPLSVANGGTNATSITDKYKVITARYPASGNANFNYNGPFYPTANVPDGYKALLCGGVRCNGFIGVAYAIDDVYGRTGSVGNAIAFWVYSGGTGYIDMNILCVKE